MSTPSNEAVSAGPQADEFTTEARPAGGLNLVHVPCGKPVAIVSAAESLARLNYFAARHSCTAPGYALPDGPRPFTILNTLSSEMGKYATVNGPLLDVLAWKRQLDFARQQLGLMLHATGDPRNG